MRAVIFTENVVYNGLQIEIFIAHGLENDIAAQGNTIEEAIDNLDLAVPLEKDHIKDIGEAPVYIFQKWEKGIDLPESVKKAVKDHLENNIEFRYYK